jgi:hypothetical protein
LSGAPIAATRIKPTFQAPWNRTLGDHPGGWWRTGRHNSIAAFRSGLFFPDFFVPRKEHGAADFDLDFGRTGLKKTNPQFLVTLASIKCRAGALKGQTGPRCRP